MSKKHLVRLVLLVFSVTYLIFMQNAFSDEYTRWGLPTDAVARFGKGKIYNVQYFPDGDKIAVATTTGTWIYDVRTGEEIDLLPAHLAYARTVVFSPDEEMFAIGRSDGIIELWDSRVQVVTEQFCYGIYTQVNL